MIYTPLYILLTDDDEGDRLVFKEILDDMNIDTIVETANNGEQLMEILENEDNVLPDLLFLDLNMPHKNGIECLKEIRNNEKYDDVLIAIYSTSASESDIETTFREGANIYITKPGDFENLKKVLTRAVTVTRQNQTKDFNRGNFVLKI